MNEDYQGTKRVTRMAWYVVGALVLLFVFFSFLAPGENPLPDMALSDLIDKVRTGQVEQITAQGDALVVRLRDGSEALSRREDGSPLSQTLRNYGVSEEQLSQVKMEVVAPPDLGWVGPLLWLLPVFAVAGIWYFMLRRSMAAGGIGQAAQFTQSKARRFNADRPQVTFAEVAGADEAKQDLAEVVEFLRDPARFGRLGARVPKGILLVGAPGTGKTLMARAVAGEAKAAFFSISGSEFVEMFVGVGAARVRDLFDQAKRNSPCILFIDEVDAVGRQRGTGLGQSNEEREQTLNQILAEMDGFDTRDNVVVLAATNRPDVLDPALLRPGRFDRRIVVDLPDIQGRLGILRIHSRGKPLANPADLERTARLTPGLSGADLENVMNEAALLAARLGRMWITASELEAAVDRVIAGPERQSRRISERERRVAAYHEAGHALVAHLVENADPVHKVSIVSRGSAGGMTWVLPTEDRYFWSESQLRDILAYALGGMAAEEIAFGQITTGSSSDLEQATRRARQMVSRFGMSVAVGPVVFGRDDHEVFLGRELGLGRDYSEATAALIDTEVRRLVDEARQRAKSLLIQYRSRLESLAKRLLDEEALRGDALLSALGPRPSGESPRRQVSEGKDASSDPLSDTNAA